MHFNLDDQLAEYFVYDMGFSPSHENGTVASQTPLFDLSNEPYEPITFDIGCSNDNLEDPFNFTQVDNKGFLFSTLEVDTPQEATCAVEATENIQPILEDSVPQKRKRGRPKKVKTEEEFISDFLPNKRQFRSINKVKQLRSNELEKLSIVDSNLFLDQLVKVHGENITHSVCYKRLSRLLEKHADYFWVEGSQENANYYFCYEPKRVKDKFREWEGLSLTHYERKLRGGKKDKELALTALKTTHPNRKNGRAGIKMWGFPD